MNLFYKEAKSNFLGVGVQGVRARAKVSDFFFLQIIQI